VVKNALEFQDPIPGWICLNVVNDIIVDDNVFMLSIDKTYEFDAFRMKLKIIDFSVVFYHSDDIGTIASVIFLWGHKEHAVNKVIRG